MNLAVYHSLSGGKKWFCGSVFVLLHKCFAWLTTDLSGHLFTDSQDLYCSKSHHSKKCLNDKWSWHQKLPDMEFYILYFNLWIAGLNGSVLKSVYFLTSLRRLSKLFNSNKSIPIFDHWQFGRLYNYRISFGCSLVNLLLVSYMEMYTYMSDDMPDQKTYSLARHRYTSIPMSNKCILCLMPLLRLGQMRTLLTLNVKLFWGNNSFWKYKC